MSDVEQVVENKSQPNQEEVKVSALDEILKERDKPKNEVTEKESVEKSKKETKEVKEVKPQENKKSDLEKEDSVEKVEKKSDVKKPVENKVDEDEEREVELSKLRKALNDSQKWGHNNSRRLKGVVKIVNSLKEQGILNDDEFNNLNSLLNSDSEDQESEVENVSDDPLENLMQLANKRIHDLHAIYEEDVLFHKKIDAVNFFCKHASQQERDEILESLEDLKENPLKIAKKFYQLGEKYYNENYKELDEAGGLKELISLKNDEIKRMQRKIDKLEKKVLEYNDYDTPTQKIDELGDTLGEDVSTDKPGDVLGSLLEKRDRMKR